MRRQQQKWICKEWCFFQFFTDRYLMEPNLLRINKRSINKILLRGIWVWVMVQCSQKMFRPFSPFLKASLFKSQASHSGCQAGATKKPSPFKCIHQAILVKSVFLTSKLGSQMCKDIFVGVMCDLFCSIFSKIHPILPDPCSGLKDCPKSLRVFQTVRVGPLKRIDFI